MRGETHTPFAADLWLAAILAYPHPSSAAVLAGAALAGLAAPWCDLDLPVAWDGRKRYSRRRKPIRHWLSYLGWYPRFRRRPVKHAISVAVAAPGRRHRDGPAHSVLVAASIAAAGTLALLLWHPLHNHLWWIFLALGLGLASHPILDLGNTYPVRLFWPLGPLVVGTGWTKVNAPRERRLRFLLTAGFFPLLAYALWSAIHP